jgi:hypothetical protein
MVVDGVLLVGVLGPLDETMCASHVKGATCVSSAFGEIS